jgi:predicted  nucleic acid-binding Zn-ribbon protein
MANTGLQNEELLKRIQKEGSTALKGKNPFGVNVFSGSVNDDGIVAGQLTKTKYNTQELVKSIDTNIFELLPPVIPPSPDVVPRPIYNEALARISELEIDVENLNVEISDLTALVSDLRITTQSLRIELDSKDLLVASVENQNQQNIQQTQGSIIDLQNSIQRATSEAIERTSIEAVNQSLLSQIDSLNAQVSDLTSTISNLNDRLVDTQNQLVFAQTVSTEQAQGAYGAADTGVTANPTITDDALAPITWRGRPRRNFEDGRFINGGTIDVFNPGENSINVTIASTGFSGKKVFKGRSFTVPAGGRFTLNLTPDIGVIDSMKRGVDVRSGGAVEFRTSQGSFEIPAELQIQRGNNYDRPNSDNPDV